MAARTSAVLGMLAVVALRPSALPAQTDPDLVWRDDFRVAQRYERSPAEAWRGGNVASGYQTALLMPPIAPLDSLTIEAEVTIGRRTGPTWTYAGIAAYIDAANSWQALLVEGPDGRRYLELIEDHEGVHQAQSAVGALTELAGDEAGDLQTWEPGRRYRVELVLGREGVSARFSDTATRTSWRRSYRFGGRQAVRAGRPALIASGVDGTFHSFQVHTHFSPSDNVITVRRGAAGSVVILRPLNGGGAAPGLGGALTKAGFSVTMLSWDDLARRRLPDGKVDLLVLADARSLPVPARDAVRRMLCSGGKVMAIGAPAASRLFTRTPDGWVDQAGWVQSVARRIERVPLRIRLDGWTRTAFRDTQLASIVADPSQGSECWKITTDLMGWDGWYADAPGAFGEDRGLLVFEARGDASTTDLAVECVEADGSRWIATVPLAAEWRPHILRASDFAYWLDSPTRNRGQAGDTLRPRRLARLSFALSASHTPKVRPGPHTYWVRGLSTAAESTGDKPDFSLTDVEALWPSYKLYPMDTISKLRSSAEQGTIGHGVRVPWKRPAYSPVWRERGRGFRRGRAWRWMPVLEAYDAKGRKRGALLSVMVGDSSFPNAVWANVGVAEPLDAIRPELLTHVVATAKAMVRGAFLLEGGTELFSYKPGEAVSLGAKALNAGRNRADFTIEVVVNARGGSEVFRARKAVRIAPGAESEMAWTWRPAKLGRRGYTVMTTLYAGKDALDRIAHRIEALRTAPGRPDEFVRVKGSGFTLGGKPWFFQGINYWPTWMAGYPSLDQRSRRQYDPEIIERDLVWLQSAGVNVLSAIQCIQPPDPNDPNAFRDQLDFLDRCLKHNIRCYMTVHAGRPYAGADFGKIKGYLKRAGLRDHPAVMCWELAWEPIEGAWGTDLEKLKPDWNKWIAERYGSVASAVADWGFDPRPAGAAFMPVPTAAQCTTSGGWDRFVAAFARAFSDLIGARYGEIVRPLRAWDPNHLITFRGGACGIPSGPVFAHIHSVGVARHMDFLCPEGYNLQTGGWANPTPPDDIRKGGLVTAYYRFVSREKPVVWMEFGYTANGFGGAWSPERLRLKPAELERQRIEIERFYAMIIESGSRGAAPWWLPGGFRLGERSDFGILEPDGSERPAARVFRAYQPRFAKLAYRAPDCEMPVDLDGNRPRAWETYAPRYLALLKDGRRPALRSVGTGTDSANCPLAAVGGALYNGHNPPRFLNAEYDRIEVQVGDAPWREVTDGAVFDVGNGAVVRCRAHVGNTGEAGWLAAGPSGAVRLAGRPEYGLAFAAPIAADTPYLGAAEVREFTLVPSVSGSVTVSFEMEAQGRAWFGERRTVTFRAR